MLTISKEASLPISICSIKRLRSLVISCGDLYHSLPNDILSKLFGELTCLRALCFHFPHSPMSEIPEEIGKFIHLRYLKLKGLAGLKQLPETLCGLYNLQNLDLSYCRNSRELPQGVGKLIKLRQLLNEETASLRYMPIGFERLSCLRTLSEFTVSGGGNSKACNLDCLKDLNHLEGKLTVRGLSNLTNGSETNRMEGLTNKKKLFSLKLKFDKTSEWETLNMNDEVVLEALQPPPNLETLSIYYFRGITVSPDWMMSLTKLRVLRLWGFDHCKHLPPLGKLPSLESLYLTFMMSLNRLGNEFWGIDSDVTSSSVILFPKLKFLEFMAVWEWEEWDCRIQDKGEEEENITIMPYLASLKLLSCSKLKAIPDQLLQRTTLKELEIEQCPILEERCKEETGDYWPKISHIPNISTLGSHIERENGWACGL